jgi:hypothetical protein
MTRLAALVVGTLACTYPKLPLLFDAPPPNDGRIPDSPGEPDGHPPPDSPNELDGGVECPLLAAYDVTFAPGSGTAVGDEFASNFGSGLDGAAETLIWDGVISLTPQANLIIQLSAGGGASTPDWPTGDVTPKSNIKLGSDGATGDALVGISVGVGSDGLPAFGYLAVSGTLDVSAASVDLSGTITNAVFRQYDNLFGSSANGPQPDPDGCMTNMPSIVYDAPLPATGSGSGVSGATRAAPPAVR